MSINKKIAIVTPVFPPYRGGIGTVAYHYARLLAERGQSVTVYAPDYGRGTPEHVPGARVEFLKPGLAFGNAAWLPGLQRRLKAYDTVVLLYPFFGSMRSVYRGKKRGQYKLVLVYNMDVVGSGLKGFLFSYATRIFLPKIVRASDLVLASSDDYARHSNLKKFWNSTEKFHVSPLGVDTERFSPGAPDAGLFAKYQLPQDKKLVLFVGGLDPAHYFKGVHHLISAARNLDNNAHVVIAGKGSLIAQYKKQAHTLGINNQITFTGGVSDDELVDLYRAASVTVLPSVDQSESFGIVLVESMACGTPVVTSDLPGVRSVYEDGVSGMRVPVGDETSLARVIISIIRDDTLQQRMSHAARKLAEERYDWKKIGDSLLTNM